MTQNAPKLTAEQKEVLYGILLGDGSLKTQTVNSYALHVEQSMVARERSPDKSLYVRHLYDIFRSLVNPETPPYVATAELGRKLCFTTLVQDCLLHYGRQFYRKTTDEEQRLHLLTGARNRRLNIKIVPKDIHKHLTDRALAYWYMDDGALKGRNRYGKTLHTERFTKEEVELLSDALKSHGIEANLNKETRKDTGKTYYKLNITKKGDIEMTERIKPYMHPVFYYKLDQWEYEKRLEDWHAFDKKQAYLYYEQIKKAHIDPQEKT